MHRLEVDCSAVYANSHSGRSKFWYRVEGAPVVRRDEWDMSGTNARGTTGVTRGELDKVGALVEFDD